MSDQRFTQMGRQSRAVIAAFEMGRRDAQRRQGNGMKIRYSHTDKDEAYQRGWKFERDRQERYK